MITNAVNLGDMVDEEDYLEFKQTVAAAILSSQHTNKPAGLIGIYLFILGIGVMLEYSDIEPEFLVETVRGLADAWSAAPSETGYVN